MSPLDKERAKAADIVKRALDFMERFAVVAEVGRDDDADAWTGCDHTLTLLLAAIRHHYPDVMASHSFDDSDRIMALALDEESWQDRMDATVVAMITVGTRDDILDRLCEGLDEEPANRNEMTVRELLGRVKECRRRRDKAAPDVASATEEPTS